MATQSPNPQTPGSESPKPPADGSGRVAQTVDAAASERPFSAPPQPVREDQVQNAVNFLSHPKVRGSPVIYRRSFLEKKGLTKDEIDEAFRRVPDPSPGATSVVVPAAAATNKVSDASPTAGSQAQALVQSPQPVSSVAMVPNAQQPRFQWSHALIAVGVLAASGAGTAVFFKNVVVPRLKTWIRKVVAEEKEREKEDQSHSLLVDQTAEAAKAAATAAAVVAKASEELISSKNEERKYFEAFMNMMDVQVKEMKTMGEAIRKLEKTRDNSNSQDKLVEEYIRSNIGYGTTNNSWNPPVTQPNMGTSSVSKVNSNGTTNPEYDAATVESTTAPPHPKSYMEIMEMVRRGERPPNIREINDAPPNPDQQPTKPVLAPRTKPWEVQQKPSYVNEENGFSSEANGKAHDSAEPWWRKKTVKITEIESENEGAERPAPRSWVPPQPPSVAIPESAVAIRQPKKQPSGEPARSDDGEASMASDDTRVDAAEGTTTGTVPAGNGSGDFVESSRSEIEEEREDGVVMS